MAVGIKRHREAQVSELGCTITGKQQVAGFYLRSAWVEKSTYVEGKYTSSNYVREGTGDVIPLQLSACGRRVYISTCGKSRWKGVGERAVFGSCPDGRDETPQLHSAYAHRRSGAVEVRRSCPPGIRRMHVHMHAWTYGCNHACVIVSACS